MPHIGFSKEHVAGVFFQPLDAIAEVAMQTLASRIKTPTLHPRTILLCAEFVVQ